MNALLGCWVLASALVCVACGSDPDSEGDAGITADGGGGRSAGSGSGGSISAGRSGGGASGSAVPQAGGAARGGNAAAGSGGSSAAGSSAPGEDGGVGSCVADCEPREHCELVEVQCFRAPCPAMPMCVPDAASSGDCDPRKITCKRTPPSCGEFQVPSVDGACFGPCVGIETCACTGPDECPDHGQYTCNLSAKHCTPYVQ